MLNDCKFLLKNGRENVNIFYDPYTLTIPRRYSNFSKLVPWSSQLLHYPKRCISRAGYQDHNLNSVLSRSQDLASYYQAMWKIKTLFKLIQYTLVNRGIIFETHCILYILMSLIVLNDDIITLSKDRHLECRPRDDYRELL